MRKRIRSYVSILLVVAFILPQLSGCTGGGGSVSGVLGPENTRVGTETLSLTMGEYPLSGEAKCTIKPASAPELEGVEMKAYDFNIETQEELFSVMELTIPYDENVLKGERPEGNIGAAYFNEGTGEWEPVSFKVNADAGTVTIYTDHLSIYGCFAVNNENTRKAYAAYAIPAFAMSTLYQGDANAIVTSAVQNGGNPDSDALEAGLEIVDKVLAVGSAGADTFSHGLNSISGASGVAAGNSLFNSIGDSLGNLGLACAIAQVAYGMYNIYNGDTDAIFPCYANALKGGIAYTAGKAGMKLVSLSFLGVLCIEYSINKFGEAAWEGRQDIYEKAYALYYESAGVKRNARDWANEFLKARETAASAERYQLRIEGLVQRYVDQFWHDETVVAEYQSEAQKNGFTGGGGLNDTMKQEISNAYKIVLYKGILQDAFKLIAEKDARKAEKDLLNELNTIRRELNRVCTLELYDGSFTDEKEKSDKAQMQAFITVPDNIQDADNWSVTLDEKGNGKIQFTLLAYIMAGAPKELRLYEKGASTEAPPAQTIPFVMENVAQRLDVGIALIPLEELLGTYEGTISISSMKVSNEGYQYYLDYCAENPDVVGDNGPLSRAECDAQLATSVDEGNLAISSIQLVSDEPELGQFRLTSKVVSSEDNESAPLSTGGTYLGGMLLLENESGESTLVATKQTDGIIHLTGQNVYLDCSDPSINKVIYIFGLSINVLKTS